MSKNILPEIAKMLDVELGEEFKIEGDNRTYWFDLDGLHSGEYVAEDEDDAMLHDLLCGEVEIVKLPWKPKQDETFYTFGIHATETKWVVVSVKWWDNVKNLALYKIGWIYRSQAEAEAALPAVAAEMGVRYEL
ncbi:hypothetical protein [Phascolarctobacterium succinatutens]|uniref:hypothetical protein n=1 Tax=Phascolarctobacterium succinatutens TaxID=626940 RepID=UPI0023F74115|nr:hypothetical protein [Phascolarctobacterium succinatutens]